MPNKQKKYVPQYKQLGLQPEIKQFAPVPPGTKVAKPSKISPRDPRMFLEHDEAPAPQQNNYKLPGVGFMPDQTYSSLDQNTFDENMDEQELDEEMIDNNEYYQGQIPENQDVTSDDYEISVEKMKNALEEGNYLLFIDNQPFANGSLQMIQKTCNQLIFGMHPNFPNVQVQKSKLFVIKRLKLTLGLSME